MKQFIYLGILALTGLGACAPAHKMYDQSQARVNMAVDPGQTLLDHHKCPNVSVMEELSFYHDYMQSQPHDKDHLKSRVVLSKSSSSCEFADKTVSVDATLHFEGELSAHSRLKQSDDPLFAYPFFVAITDRSGDILAKQIFSASLHYPAHETHGTYSETIRQIIPINSPTRAQSYSIIAGFQLTDTQLAENRALIEAAKNPAPVPAPTPKEAEPKIIIQSISNPNPTAPVEPPMARKPESLVPAQR